MKVFKKSKLLRFGWKHILIIFLTLIVFQVFVSHLQQDTLKDHLSETMDWYKKNSAEQIGNLTTTTLEVLLESDSRIKVYDKELSERDLVHAFNSILKQPLMNRNVEAMCIILPYKDKYIAADLGQQIYSYFYEHQVIDTTLNLLYREAVERYRGIHKIMIESELTTSFQQEQNLFQVYVPLVPYGEYAGAVYLKIHPDVSFISQQVLSSFNKTVLIFSSLILVGLLGMFYISTYTIMDRDEARELLFREREEHLREHIAQKKEYLFTKRIYHTHHKAEKIMGFINEDLDKINGRNINEIKYRISKYANFISRVIYDMKWYNPPIHTIRGIIFSTNLNELLKFIIDNIFLRISNPVKSIKFRLDLDSALPELQVNEFVVWEIIEPLIQNSIDHSDMNDLLIKVVTKYYPDERKTVLSIIDNGKGIKPEFLEPDNYGIKRIFLENVSTKDENKNCGYGCYLAYEISKRCGWEINANNNKYGGCTFAVIITH